MNIGNGAVYFGIKQNTQRTNIIESLSSIVAILDIYLQITREIKSKYSTEYRICFKAVSSVSFSTFQIKPHSSKMPILQKNSFAFSDGHAFISPTLKNMFHKVTASRNFTLSRLKNVYKWMSHAFRLISLHLCVAPCQWAGWWDAWLLFAGPDPCWRAAH